MSVLDDIITIDISYPTMYYILMEDNGQKYLKLATEFQVEEFCVLYNETKEEFIDKHTISIEKFKEMYGANQWKYTS